MFFHAIYMSLTGAEFQATLRSLTPNGKARPGKNETFLGRLASSKTFWALTFQMI
jgi:hypothetical protein